MRQSTVSVDESVAVNLQHIIVGAFATGLNLIQRPAESGPDFLRQCPVVVAHRQDDFIFSPPSIAAIAIRAAEKEFEIHYATQKISLLTLPCAVAGATRNY